MVGFPERVLPHYSARFCHWLLNSDAHFCGISSFLQQQHREMPDAPPGWHCSTCPATSDSSATPPPACAPNRSTATFLHTPDARSSSPKNAAPKTTLCLACPTQGRASYPMAQSAVSQTALRSLAEKAASRALSYPRSECMQQNAIRRAHARIAPRDPLLLPARGSFHPVPRLESLDAGKRGHPLSEEYAASTPPAGRTAPSPGPEETQSHARRTSPSNLRKAPRAPCQAG
jgi:hypothetical protein